MSSESFVLRDLRDRESLKPSHASYDDLAQLSTQQEVDPQRASSRADTEPLVDSHSAWPTSEPSRSSILLWWLPEIAASAFSLISFASMIWLLYTFDGHGATTPRLPRPLTLNGLLALISTINKACLTAPMASATMQEMWLHFTSESSSNRRKSRLRDLDSYGQAALGHVGSLKFLLHVRLWTGPRYLAHACCALSLLSLLFSTFTQQLISLEVLPAKTQAPLASIPRSEEWAQYTGAWDEGDLFPTLDMVAAIYSGTLSADIQLLQAECPSGNCTWPSTPSMAVCGECVPSTFEVYSCPPVTPGYCNYTLPSGDSFILSDFRNLTSLSDDSNPTMAFAALPVSRPSAVFNATNDQRAYVDNWYMFGAPYGARRNELLQFQNTECALWMCVNTYSTSVQDGRQEETLVDTFDRFEAPLDSAGQLDTSVTSTWRLHNSSNSSSSQAGATESFTINEWALTALGAFVTGAMNSTVFLEKNGQSYTSSADFMRGIWKGSANPQAWLRNLTLSMTNVVRASDSSQRAQYEGTPYVLTIRIRWRWLVFPAALVLASVCVLGAVIVKTARSPIPSWKGSLLTLLLFGLDETLREIAISHINQRNGISKAIGERNVRFRQGKNGLWEFRASDLYVQTV